jgi:predicted amidophosphoribosyltransferase
MRRRSEGSEHGALAISAGRLLGTSALPGVRPPLPLGRTPLWALRAAAGGPAAAARSRPARRRPRLGSAAHEGVARDLVAALKFRRLLPVAALIAERIAWLAPGSLLSGEIVPVPTARLRSLSRGFDPAMEIADALSGRTGLPLSRCLERRGAGRQVGRRRAERLGRPPSIRARSPVPRSVLLVDDVLTTGATVSACARALRGAGARRVVALTFARRL